MVFYVVNRWQEAEVARIRTIKPEFWTSEQVASCSPMARLLFIGIWNFADDGGVHPDSPARLKMEILPADAISIDDVAALLDELIGNGLLERYEAEGKSWLHVTGWQSHQRIDKPSYRYPSPEVKTGEIRRIDSVAGQQFDDHSTTIRRPFDECSTSVRRPFDDHSTTEGKGRETETEGNGISNVRTLGVPSSERIEVTDQIYADCRDRLRQIHDVVDKGRKLLPQDRKLAIHAAVLARERLGEGWLDELLASHKIRRGAAQNRWAYFAKACQRSAEQLGVDWHAEVKRIVIPDGLLNGRPVQEATA